MIDRLLHALIHTRNEAADDVLLEALRVGNPDEKQVALDGLIRRKTTAGLTGVIGQYEALPERLKLTVLENVREFHHALRECGRSSQATLRLAAMKLIALGRQGKLAYVLSENLHGGDDPMSKAATEAMVALARWVATETRRLQNTGPAEPRSENAAPRSGAGATGGHQLTTYQQLLEQRPEIEAAVARAMDVHRGKHGQELLRAALLLCDWPGSKTLAILHTAKHGGQSPMVRRLQQPPASEQIEAFLLGASHGQLRSHFAIAFAHIEEAPVLDALLRKTYWLKDHALQLCMHQVSRGAWWGSAELARDIERRSPDEAGKIGEWIACSGSHDVLQDERLEQLRLHAKASFAARLRLFRIAARRKRGASVDLIRGFLKDPDERLMRLAAREIVRRRPVDFENILLQLMTDAPESVRRVISRSIGQAGFEHFWGKFDKLNKPTRKRAGQAMLKLLPDGPHRLARRLATGPVDQRIKALQMAHELGLAASMKDALVLLCDDPNPRVRSKAVAVAGEVQAIDAAVLIDRLLNDTDARVRANTIEVLEARNDPTFLPILIQRARAANNRERANAIKAINRMRVGVIGGALGVMLRDPRAEHRISALWALKQMGWWQLLGEVGRLAKADTDLRVRRYALGVLRGVAEMAKATTAKAG